MDFEVRTAVAAALAGGGDAPAVAFAGRWRSWAWLAAFRAELDALLAEADLAPHAAAALVARNRPAHLAVVAAQTASGRLTSMIYSAQSPIGIAADIRTVAAPVVLADAQDWTVETLAAARDIGALAVAIATDAPMLRVVERPARPAVFLARDSGIGFEMLSSGTTGLPKRIPLRWSTLSSATCDARTSYAGTADCDAPQIMLHPIGNVAGVAYLLPIFAYARRVVLMERFEADAWVDVVRTYRPSRASLPAAAMRMVLDLDSVAADLASLRVIVVGGSALDPDLQDAFEARFGIPVLTAFGATEFAGVIANWSLDDYRRFGVAKRGSAGRASANVALRVVDRNNFAPLPRGATGLLEARVERIGPDWIRTNDLASLDADGFLFIHGRADDAINRGGFKVVPDIVATALKSHRAVRDAVVVAMSDRRLGHVPVAAVELEPLAEVSPDELLAYLRDRLVAYQIPVEIRIVDTLPRNPSMKVARSEVEALFASEGG